MQIFITALAVGWGAGVSLCNYLQPGCVCLLAVSFPCLLPSASFGVTSQSVNDKTYFLDESWGGGGGGYSRLIQNGFLRVHARAADKWSERNSECLNTPWSCKIDVSKTWAHPRLCERESNILEGKTTFEYTSEKSNIVTFEKKIWEN